MKRRQLTAAAACIAMLLTAWTTRADVLAQLPGDALVVLKVNNLKGTSDKFARFAQDLGVAAMEPRMEDPLGFVQEQTKMVNGVNTAGDLGIAFLNPDTSGADVDRSIVILIPVTDYQAFVGNFEDAQVDGDVTQVKMGDSDEPGYLANWGSYAALSPAREVVAKKPNGGFKVPAAVAKQLSDRDAIVVANFNQLRSKLAPQLAEAREEIISEMEAGLGNDPNAEKFAPLIKPIVNRLVDVADSFLRDAEAATIGLSLTEDGIATTVLAEFTPDSYLGKLVTASKDSRDHLLAGLPSGKYLMYGGTISDPEVAVKFLDDLALPVVKEIVAAGPEFKAVDAYYQGLRQYVAANTGSTFGLFKPSGQLGAGAIIQGVSVLQGDADKMIDGYRQMTSSQQDIMRALGLPDNQMQVSFTENARTIDGVNFHLMQSDVAVGDPGDPQAEMARQFITMFYGSEKVNVYMGTVNGNLLSFIGASDEAVSSAIAAVKGGSSPLADSTTLKAVASNLPTERVAAVYIQLDEIVNTGVSYARAFGMPVGIQLPPDLPPIGVTFGSDGSALRFDSYVPTQLVQSLVAAGMQAAMQMGGGPGGGGL